MQTLSNIPISWHSRIAMGVVKQYEIVSNSHLFLVELWRGNVRMCSCGDQWCQHGKLALLLEEQYQAEHLPNDLGSCLHCGRMARVVRGIAICPNCAS